MDRRIRQHARSAGGGGFNLISARPRRAHKRLQWLLAIGLVVSFELLAPAPAEADIGVYRVTPRVGAPGEPVELSVGCGACLAISVVRGPEHPPAAFPVSLIPVARASKPPTCVGRSAECSPAPVRLPRKRPFVFLGRAKPLFTEQQLPRIRIPQYRLRFRIPRVEPNAYAFVIYCGGCYAGPRGSLIVDTSSPGRLLRVRQGGGPIASTDTRTDGTWWFAGIGAFAVLIATALLLRWRLMR